MPRAHAGGMGTRDCALGLALVGKQGTNSGKSTISGGRGVVFLSKHASIPQNCEFTSFGEWGGSANRRRPRFIFLRAGIRAGRCVQSAFWEKRPL